MSLTNRESLKRRFGHFSSGQIVAPNGQRMVKFELDFPVTIDELNVLNAACNGIRHCKRVAHSHDPRIIFLQFSHMDENEMIRTALHYRGKAEAAINNWQTKHGAKVTQIKAKAQASTEPATQEQTTTSAKQDPTLKGTNRQGRTAPTVFSHQ